MAPPRHILRQFLGAFPLRLLAPALSAFRLVSQKVQLAITNYPKRTVRVDQPRRACAKSVWQPVCHFRRCAVRAGKTTPDYPRVPRTSGWPEARTGVQRVRAPAARRRGRRLEDRRGARRRLRGPWRSNGASTPRVVSMSFQWWRLVQELQRPAPKEQVLT